MLGWGGATVGGDIWAAQLEEADNPLLGVGMTKRSRLKGFSGSAPHSALLHPQRESEREHVSFFQTLSPSSLYPFCYPSPSFFSHSPSQRKTVTKQKGTHHCCVTSNLSLPPLIV